ncbi:hypothetical protein ES704_03964 [subsurface metagenome]
MQKTVAIVGTLDTKGAEYRFLKDQIEANNVSTLVIDTGIVGEPAFNPDVPASEVAKAGGIELNELLKERDRGHSVAVMSEGAAVIVKDLYDKGKLQGVISMGGSAGTTIGTSAMRALPIGVPKLMLSTIASGDTRPYVDVKDVTMMNSVVDISGINRLSRRILTNAAAAIAGMVKVEVVAEAQDRPLIAATMFGVTTPCVTKAREILESAGYEVLVFHATGIGGRAMEDLVRGGFIKGVLDITTHELADELVGGVCRSGPSRLETAGELGIPQVIVPGALDMVNFWAHETMPDKFKGRKFYKHNPSVTLMRSTREENEELGKIMAEKLNRAKGPTTVVIPRKGVSAIDKEGQPFYDPEADARFVETLKSNLSDRVSLIEMDNHINDEQFASSIANVLLENLKK